MVDRHEIVERQSLCCLGTVSTIKKRYEQTMCLAYCQDSNLAHTIEDQINR